MKGERKVVEEILARCAIDVVPYIPILGDPMYYADSSKAKEYIQAGIPIIMTRVLEAAVTIEQEKAGFAVEYDKDGVAKAIITVLRR